MEEGCRGRNKKQGKRKLAFSLLRPPILHPQTDMGRAHSKLQPLILIVVILAQEAGLERFGRYGAVGSKCGVDLAQLHINTWLCALRSSMVCTPFLPHD